MNYESSEHTIN